MTPKKNAIELVKKFSQDYFIAAKLNERKMYLHEAIHCALIICDEFIIQNKRSNHKFSQDENDWWVLTKIELNKLR
jgi:hypothetical protein